MRKKLNKILSLVTLLTFWLVTVYGQEHGKIPVNAEFPNVKFFNILNYTSDTASLADFQKNKTKLVIFDFWATWCAPCIKLFPKLESIQRELPNEIQIVLVTVEPKDKIITFLSKWEEKNKMKLSLPIITQDSILNNQIFRGAMSHFIWIDPQWNTMGAQTGSKMINKEIISTYVKELKSRIGKK